MASQAHLLLDYAQRLDRHRTGRRAIHVHLSRLKPQNRRDQHVRVAVNTFEDLVRQHEGQIFVLANSDIVFISRDAAITDIDNAVMRLRYLFSEDPLAQGEDEETLSRFSTWYNIETQYPQFLALAEQLENEEQRWEKRLAAALETGENAGHVDERRPLRPDQLGRLEEVLQGTDLSSVMRRQPICAVASDSASPQPILREVFVSIADLATTVLPDVNLSANRWLFQHLTQTLDRRVLRHLGRADDSSLFASISINLNVSTILGPDFLEFDGSLRAGSRGTIVIEIQPVDIFADYSAFAFARDFARERGYRICLDGVGANFLALIDRRRMGLDLVKINWTPDMGEDGAHGELKAHVEQIGKTRVILARCDGADAIRVGQKAGISLFQGYHLDRLLQSRRQYTSPPRRAPRRLAR